MPTKTAPRTVVLTLTGEPERRRLPRTPIGRKILATINRHEQGIAVVGVHIIDSNATGVGIHSPIPLNPGDLVGFHPDASAIPSRLTTVIRCEPEGEGFRVGLANIRRANAA